MGIATSLFLTHPTTLQGCFVGIIGGAIGGVVCDIDAVKKDYQNDALAGQGLAFGISIFNICLFFRLFFKYGNMQFRDFKLFTCNTEWSGRFFDVICFRIL
ncbi:MAG: hypothetical protein LUD54_06600 [Oscillospiraceae bacterium]|nr:hypothetical protein [Oscillospiraceae bacterium]